MLKRLDNLFRLPGDVLRSFQKLTNWRDDSLVSNQLLVIEPGLYYNSSFNGTLRFTIKGGLDVEIPTYELAHPVRGLDEKGKKVLQNNVTVVNILNQESLEGTAML